MNNDLIRFSVMALLRAVTITCLLCITIVYASVADARQGCGAGYHRCYRANGQCVPNGQCTQRWYRGGCWVNGRHLANCNRLQ